MHRGALDGKVAAFQQPQLAQVQHYLYLAL